jgi:FkbM family methyltransferase
LAWSVPRLEFAQEKLQAEGYHSQWGQDKWIVEALLPGMESGVFVDVGAHDGVSFSNTLYLEQRLGWTGLAVEPIPEIFEKLRSNRRCAVVNGCVGSQSGKARFQVVSGYAEMLSGLIDSYDPRHLKRIESELKMYSGNRREIEVNCYTANELLEKHGIDYIDYLSIDVEGAEYSILSTLDFGRCNISVIGVENSYRDWRIPQLLKQRGFEFHAIVGDEFYIRR